MSLSYSKIRQNLLKNVGLVAWLVAIFWLANIIMGLIVRLQQAIVPNLVSSRLDYAQLLILLTYGLVLKILIFLPRWLPFKKELKQELTLEKQDLALTGWLKWRDIGLAIAGFILAIILRVVVLMILEKIFPDTGWTRQKQDLGFKFGLQNSRFELTAVFVILVIVAPVVEEIIFRGYLFAKVRARSSFFVTTLVVSLLFGIAHYDWNGGWVFVLVTGLLSVVLCLTREVSKSIYPAIIIHMINNGLAFAALLYLPNVLGN